MPHDIGRQWSAVHSGNRADRSLREGHRREDGEPGEAFSGRMLTRARGIAASALLRDPQSSAATTVCNTDARRGTVTSSDSDDFTTPVPVRRRNTVCTILSRQDASDSVAARRWSTPAATQNETGIHPQSELLLPSGSVSFAQNVCEAKRKPRRAKPLSQITPSAMTNPVAHNGTASDEPVNRKRGWSMESSGEHLGCLGESMLPHPNIRAKRVKITDAVPI